MPGIRETGILKNRAQLDVVKTIFGGLATLERVDPVSIPRRGGHAIPETHEYRNGTQHGQLFRLLRKVFPDRDFGRQLSRVREAFSALFGPSGLAGRLHSFSA